MKCNIVENYFQAVRILLIDNFDSFTFNLVHRLENQGVTVVVLRNDEFYQAELAQADALVLSPGPGLPKEAGSLLKMIQDSKKSMPILGVCLGHQALLQSDGAELTNMNLVRHGERDFALVSESSELFRGLGNQVEIGLYHSWAIRVADVPSNYLVTAQLNGFVMAVEHKFLPIYGVQFHPESVLTPKGDEILSNWLTAVKQLRQRQVQGVE